MLTQLEERLQKMAPSSGRGIYRDNLPQQKPAGTCMARGCAVLDKKLRCHRRAPTVFAKSARSGRRAIRFVNFDKALPLPGKGRVEQLLPGFRRGSSSVSPSQLKGKIRNRDRQPNKAGHWHISFQVEQETL